jgi:hypothetical protein
MQSNDFSGFSPSQSSYEKTKPAKRENIKRAQSKPGDKQKLDKAKLRDNKRNIWS